MAGGQGNTDLAFLLHAADARAMAGARVDYDERRLAGVDGRTLRRYDVGQGVIDGPRQGAAVAHHLELEGERVRRCALNRFKMSVAALAQDVEHQHRALPGVD